MLRVLDPEPLAAPRLMRQATALLDAGTARLEIELAALPDGRTPRLWLALLLALGRRARACGSDLKVLYPPASLVSPLARAGVQVMARHESPAPQVSRAVSSCP